MTEQLRRSSRIKNPIKRLSVSFKPKSKKKNNTNKKYNNNDDDDYIIELDDDYGVNPVYSVNPEKNYLKHNLGFHNKYGFDSHINNHKAQTSYEIKKAKESINLPITKDDMTDQRITAFSNMIKKDLLPPSYQTTKHFVSRKLKKPPKFIFEINANQDNYKLKLINEVFGVQLEFLNFIYSKDFIKYLMEETSKNYTSITYISIVNTKLSFIIVCILASINNIKIINNKLNIYESIRYYDNNLKIYIMKFAAFALRYYMLIYNNKESIGSTDIVGLNVVELYNIYKDKFLDLKSELLIKKINIKKFNFLMSYMLGSFLHFTYEKRYKLEKIFRLNFNNFYEFNDILGDIVLDVGESLLKFNDEINKLENEKKIKKLYGGKIKQKLLNKKKKEFNKNFKLIKNLQIKLKIIVDKLLKLNKKYKELYKIYKKTKNKNNKIKIDNIIKNIKNIKINKIKLNKNIINNKNKNIKILKIINKIKKNKDFSKYKKKMI